MPSMREYMESFVDQLNLQRIKRGKRREKEVQLLPEDLTGQVFLACRREAELVRKRLDWLDAEIDRTNTAIKAARTSVTKASRQIYFPARRRGSVLGEFKIEDPQPQKGAMQMTPEAMKIKREKLQPLQRKLEALEAEKYARTQELGELRRIAEKASNSEIGLIHFLSDKWRSRLELGAGVEGVRAKLSGRAVAFTDLFGNELPPEALKDDGTPDLPAAGRVPEGFTAGKSAP